MKRCATPDARAVGVNPPRTAHPLPGPAQRAAQVPRITSDSLGNSIPNPRSQPRTHRAVLKRGRATLRATAAQDPGKKPRGTQDHRSARSASEDLRDAHRQFRTMSLNRGLGWKPGSRRGEPDSCYVEGVRP